MRVVVIDDNGRQQDITEAVKRMGGLQNIQHQMHRPMGQHAEPQNGDRFPHHVSPQGRQMGQPQGRPMMGQRIPAPQGRPMGMPMGQHMPQGRPMGMPMPRGMQMGQGMPMPNGMQRIAVPVDPRTGRPMVNLPQRFEGDFQPQQFEQQQFPPQCFEPEPMEMEQPSPYYRPYVAEPEMTPCGCEANGDQYYQGY